VSCQVEIQTPSEQLIFSGEYLNLKQCSVNNQFYEQAL
jgi:hypothetical protein